jgi:hypothetical protein
MPSKLEDPWFDADHEMRRVRTDAPIKWRGDFVLIGEALVGEVVGLADLENGAHVVRFSTRDLGILERDVGFRRFAPPRIGLRETANADNANLSAIIPVDQTLSDRTASLDDNNQSTRSVAIDPEQDQLRGGDLHQPIARVARSRPAGRIPSLAEQLAGDALGWCRNSAKTTSRDGRFTRRRPRRLGRPRQKIRLH